MATKPSKKKPAKKPAKQPPTGGDPMRDLQKLLQKQDFNSMAEIEAFMKKISKGPIPIFEPEGDEENAEDLIYQAMELEGEAQRELIMEALDLDPDCIAAYHLLGLLEVHPAIALAFYERGLTIGADRFETEEYMERSKGHFWGLTETRPFMQCLQGAADCEFFLGRIPDAMAAWHLMLELNPNDNQGIRYNLMLCLAGMCGHEEYEKLHKAYSDDASAAAAFNHVLYLFTKHGAGPQAAQALHAARACNKYVVPLLLKDEPPEYRASGFAIGSKEEAIAYMDKGQLVWSSVPGAKEWLKGVAGK